MQRVLALQALAHNGVKGGGSGASGGSGSSSGGMGGASNLSLLLCV